jgi:hypothetical protein
MNDNVFAPAGIATVPVTPTLSEPTLAYPFPYAGERGGNGDDWFPWAGPAGFQMSSDELTRLFNKLREGAIIDQASVAEMDANYFGWDWSAGVRHGEVYVKGGSLNIAWTGFPGQFATGIVSFTTGPQVGILVNSATPKDFFALAIDAYEAAWLPTE